MKRKNAFIEVGRAVGGEEPAVVFTEAVRVLGVNKKTGKLWVKSRHPWGFCTVLVDASELIA